MHSLYQENIIDHAKNPRNFGTLENSVAHKEVNTLCGDEMEMYVGVKENKLTEVKFTATGCAISLASASILTEFVKDKSLDEIAALTKEDVVALLGISLSPTRLKCALLPLHTLKNAIKNNA